MARVRNAFTIAEEIKAKLKEKDVTGDEIAQLFREAYDLLPSDEQMRNTVLDKLSSMLRNATNQKNKDLLTEEQKTELRAIRDNGGKKPERAEDVVATVLENEEKSDNQNSGTGSVVLNFGDEGVVSNDYSVNEPISLEFGDEVVGNGDASDGATPVTENLEPVASDGEELVDDALSGAHEDEDGNEEENQEPELTPEEKHNNMILSTVTPTDKELDSLSFIDVKASKKSLYQAVMSEKPEVALMSVEDTLVANKYFVVDNEKDDDVSAKQKEVIYGVMKHHLENIIGDVSQITPDNAVALMAICLSCKDPALKELVDQAKLAIATALSQYDKVKFAELSVEQLNSNYEALQKDAKKFDPFSVEPSNDDEFNLSTLTFIDENGKEITDKKVIKSYQECIVALAREQACQEMVTQDDYKAVDLNTKIKENTFKIIGSTSPTDAGGKWAVRTQTLASTIAIPQSETETFKTRVCQRFKNSKFAKAVSKSVKSVDNKLTERFGEKYTTSKNVLKFIAKTTSSVAKTSALYGVAGLVPGGTAVLMGYNLYKNWKSVGPQLKDKNKSILQKAGVIASVGLTSALTLTGIGASVGLGANTLVEAGVLSPESIGATMSNMGKYARMGVVAVASALPNAMESVSLKIKQMKLNWALKKIDKLKDSDGKPLSEEEKAKKIAAIIDDQKKLKVKQNANLKELATKSISVLGGMAAAQLISPVINQEIQEMREKAGDLLDAAKQVSHDGGIAGSGAEATKQAFNEGKSHNPFNDRPSPLLPEENEASDRTSPWKSMIEKHGIYDRDGDGKVDLPWSDAAREASANEGRTPDDVAAKTVEHDAKNLEASKVAGSSGLGNVSSYDHAVRHLDNLNDSRIGDTAAMAENLCEHFGDDANKAVIACKMAPYALQAELGLELPEGVKPTSYQMLNYIAEHDLTPEQQAKFDQFLDKNFDGVKFKTENFPDWNKPVNAVENNQNQTQTSAQEPKVNTPPKEQVAQNVAENKQTVEVKVKFEMASNHPAGYQVAHQSMDHMYANMSPQDRYAMERGYMPCPEFSRGLDFDGSRDGTFKGYYGTYVNPETGKVLYMPNDMVIDRGMIKEVTIGNAHDHMRMAAQGYGQNMYNNHNGSYLGCSNRHMYPGGLGYGGSHVAYEASSGQKFWNVLDKINAVSSTVSNVAHNASHAAHDVSRTIHAIKGRG